jgi:hypothetical protein
MPRPVTAWAVQLTKGAAQDDVKGTLELQDDALAFSPADAHPDLRIPLVTISKVRRLRGSPVLMVVYGTPEGAKRTAFYFAQPPPLGVLLGQDPLDRPRGLEAFRSPKRRARRDNVGYLGVTNRQKKDLLMEWVRAVRVAIGN